ncbi:BrnT family toxin [Myxococcota bacterium]|nr:BrnT family toxin [Myxococcota bacterium]
MVEWDRQKADADRLKHGVELADAAIALTDELAITRADDDPDEERFVAIGTDALGRVVVVSYTWRGDDVRLISARRASPRERRLYEGRRP